MPEYDSYVWRMTRPSRDDESISEVHGVGFEGVLDAPPDELEASAAAPVVIESGPGLSAIDIDLLRRQFRVAETRTLQNAEAEAWLSSARGLVDYGRRKSPFESSDAFAIIGIWVDEGGSMEMRLEARDAE